MDNKGMVQNQNALGDVAVNGILAGIGAGLVGALFLIILGLATGVTVSETLERFDPQQSGNAMVGIIAHLGVSAVYGVLFAVLLRPLNRRITMTTILSLVFGLIYGLALMLIAELLFTSGIKAGLGDIPRYQFALFHIIYGVTLAGLMKTKFR
jgi:hypothetical protein